MSLYCPTGKNVATNVLYPRSCTQYNVIKFNRFFLHFCLLRCANPFTIEIHILSNAKVARSKGDNFVNIKSRLYRVVSLLPFK